MQTLSEGWKLRAFGVWLRGGGGGRSSAVLVDWALSAGEGAAVCARGLRGVVRGGGRSSGASCATARGGGRSSAAWAGMSAGRVASDRLRGSYRFFMGDIPIPGFRRQGLAR